MKRLIVLMLMFVASTAMGQSDCNAPYCGMVPLLNFDSESGSTDLYVHYVTDCEAYFRIRFSPTENGVIPEPLYYHVPAGDERIILRGIMGLWGEVYKEHGTLIIDWATFDCQPQVFAAGIYNDNFNAVPCGTKLFYNIAKPDQFEPGCYYFYADTDTTSVFNVYNEDDYGIQVVEHDGEYTIVTPGATEAVVIPWYTHFVRLCVGVQPPGPSLPGLDLDLPLYIEGLSYNPDGDIYKIIYLE